MFHSSRHGSRVGIDTDNEFYSAICTIENVSCVFTLMH